MECSFNPLYLNIITKIHIPPYRINRGPKLPMKLRANYTIFALLQYPIPNLRVILRHRLIGLHGGIISPARLRLARKKFPLTATNCGIRSPAGSVPGLENMGFSARGQGSGIRKFFHTKILRGIYIKDYPSKGGPTPPPGCLGKRKGTPSPLPFFSSGGCGCLEAVAVAIARPPL